MGEILPSLAIFAGFSNNFTAFFFRNFPHLKCPSCRRNRRLPVTECRAMLRNVSAAVSRMFRVIGPSESSCEKLEEKLQLFVLMAPWIFGINLSGEGVRVLILEIR